MICRIVAGLIVFAGLQTIVLAQPNFNTPYSSNGIGIINTSSTTFDRGMGASIGLTNPHFLTLKNPALVAESPYTVFDYGIEWQSNRLATDQSVSTSFAPQLSYLNFSFPISKRVKSALGFTPYSRSNYSFESSRSIGNDQVDYVYEGNGGISKLFWSTGVRVLSDTSKQGKLNAGVEVGFLFGKQTRVSSSQLVIGGEKENIINSFDDITNFKGLLVKPGIYYSRELRGVHLDTNETFENLQQNTTEGDYFMLIQGKEKTYVSSLITDEAEKLRLLNLYKTFKTDLFGIYVKKQAEFKTKEELTKDFIDTYNRSLIKKSDTLKVETDISALKEYITDKKAVSYSLGLYYQSIPSLSLNSLQTISQVRDFDLQVINTDTTSIEDDVRVSMPYSVGFGIGLQKPYPTGKESKSALSVWRLGLDVVYTNWSNSTQTITEYDNTTFAISIGGEYIPDPKGNSPVYAENNSNRTRKYFNRVIYRGGFRYATLPIMINGENLSEFGINFGLSLPMGGYSLRQRPKYANIMMEIGQRGNLSNNDLKEQFFNTTISFIVNERWFTKRKIGL